MGVLDTGRKNFVAVEDGSGNDGVHSGKHQVLLKIDLVTF